MTDSERENRVELLGHAIMLESDLVRRACMWREMRDLILGRSPAQVQSMEKAKGLQ